MMQDLDRVFAYGTLQFDDVVQAVTGRRFAGAEAFLPGYRRRRLLARSYPGIEPAEGDRTPGLLYRDVDAETLARLDVFESDIYDRLPLEVTTLAGERVVAWTYVVAPPHRHRLSPEPWEPEVFLRDHGEAFVASCKRFRSEGVV